jgi:Putative Flp pilus-assembly TadE/G-like
MTLLRRIAREQRGSMAITVVMLFPVFLLLGVLAVDVGNWYVHKRELQTQADAAALAGAAYFKYPCVDAPIGAAAQSYAGKDHNVFPNVPSARSTFLLNAQSFFEQSNPNDTDVSGSPCADGAVDVKMTEKNVPWFFGNLFTPYINAQARVSIRRLERLDGLLPVGVPAPDAKRMRVTFISEVTGETLGYKDLCKRTDPESGLQIWDNASSNAAGWNETKGSCDKDTPASPLPQTFDDPKYARVGVRVQISGSPATINCGEQLVTCYDAGSTDGAGFVHGWSDQPGVADAASSAPQPRSVILLPGSCGDAYFSAKSTACAIGLRAKFDFQPREYDASGTPRNVTVKAVVTNASGSSSSYNLAWDAATKTWQTSSIAVASGAGPLSVKLDWEQTDNGVAGYGDCKSGNKNPCKDTTGVVQRTFSASPSRSGPVQLLQIGDASSSSGVNDVQRCSSANPSCTTNFVVRVGIAGTLELSKPTDPPTVLRVAGASQTQAIDCDPDISNLKDEIARGCGPQYGRNTGQACPDHSATGAQAPGATWYCLWTQTGSSPSQVSAGMNERILGDAKARSCTAPNHWPNYDPGDPRIVPVFVVPYGSFQGSGNDSFAVQDFAYFYVTGWTGQGNGFDNPCQGNGDDPVPGNDAGDIVGYFIKYVETPNNGGGGDTPCDLSGGSISGCVAVMTR